MTQKATDDWQLHHDNTPTHVSCLVQFFCETANHWGDSVPLQPRFGTLRCLAFPKTKITFEKEEISDCQWDSGKIQWGGCCQLEELCEDPRYLLWMGLKCHCPMYSGSCVFFTKCLYFSWLDTFWTDHGLYFIPWHIHILPTFLPLSCWWVRKDWLEKERWVVLCFSLLLCHHFQCSLLIWVNMSKKGYDKIPWWSMFFRISFFFLYLKQFWFEQKA